MGLKMLKMKERKRIFGPFIDDYCPCADARSQHLCFND